MWKNYGNDHTIFDASNSTTPIGTATNNTNPDNAWVPTYPTLMGYNGVNTYGVRVDSSRYADSATNAGYANSAGSVSGSVVATATAGLSYLAVGSYAFARIKASIPPGSTAAGSNLISVGFLAQGDGSTYLYATGSAFTGTWLS